MSVDLLTIVVPIKNEEKNLPECLDNVKALEYVVIVDSGERRTVTLST